MNKHGTIVLILTIVLFILTSCPPVVSTSTTTTWLSAQWAQTVSFGSNDSKFNSVAVDTSGNIYAAGYINGREQFGFGNSITATGTNSNDNSQGGYSYYGSNIILVKYNSSGVAQWARTVSAGSEDSIFTSVAVDSSGNIYAAGYISGTATYDFGNSVTATGSCSALGILCQNVLLVKYNSAGVAQWAQTTSAGFRDSYFHSVAVDSSGNIYAAGYISGTATYDFGNSVTSAGANSSNNIILVKYNSSGVAQWSQTVSAGSDISWFGSVAVDSSSNIYAAGGIFGTGQFCFGNSITARGKTGDTGESIILVKYNSSGVAQWAQTVSAGSDTSWFNSVKVDSLGNIYASGGIAGTTQFGFGNSVTATGTNSNSNILLVNYNSSGVAQWAQTVSSGSSDSVFRSVAMDSSGNIYVAGDIGSHQYGFGNSVSADGGISGTSLIVKYNPSGLTQWAQTVNAADISIAEDSVGNIYAAGSIYGTGQVDYGNSVIAIGTHWDSNILLVKYQ